LSTALVAWVLLTVLTALQLSLSSAAARADASASRLATSVTATVLASQLRASLTADAVRTGIDLSMSGLARQFVAVTADDPRQEAIGVARHAISDDVGGRRRRHDREPVGLGPARRPSVWR